MQNSNTKDSTVGAFPCSQCGADLTYKAGTAHLNCQYCGAENEIPQVEGNIEEFDFLEYLQKEATPQARIVETYVKCESCGASSTLDPNISSSLCPYCSTPLVVDQAEDTEILQPKSLLPFELDKKTAKGLFKEWTNKLWFAPGSLKKAVLSFDHFRGVYIPFWTYDTDTATQYRGERGDHYYETETYTTTKDGETVTEEREVRKTRWHSTYGNIHEFFDDILIPGTKSLPTKYLDKLEPWDLENLIPYDKSYLSGFITEKYQVELEDGFNSAKQVAQVKIDHLIRRDIGGDEQRITSRHTDYRDITFKLLLLPVYVSAYKYKEKQYQFLVNGRTGEVQGERPYSWIKIASLVVLIVAIIGGIVFYLNR